MITGVVTAVDRVWSGGTLSADVTSTATVLPVDDAGDFDEEFDEPRFLVIGDETTPREYVAVENDEDLPNTVTLAAAVGATYEAGLPVIMWDPASEADDKRAIEFQAWVRLDDQDDAESIPATIPHDLIPQTGVYSMVGAHVRLDEWDEEDWHVADVIGRHPVVDGSYIPPETLPPAVPSTDGNAPTASPTPVLRAGIGTLFVTWAEVVNVDPVTYEVHLSTTSGFTPSSSTLVGSVLEGTGPVVARTLPGTSTPLVAGTTYYVRMIARDADGSGPAGVEVAGSPAQATSADIAADAVTANHLTANDALIDALKVSDLSTVNLEAVNIEGGSIAIATSVAATHPQAFADTSLPAGWSATTTVTDGYVAPDVSVVSSPSGGSGSSLLLDTGPSGQTAGTLSHVVDTGVDVGDFEVLFKYQALVESTDGFWVDLCQKDGKSYRLYANGHWARVWRFENGLAVGVIAEDYATAWWAAGWRWIRVRRVAGAISLSHWADGTAEPSPTTGQTAFVLPEGSVVVGVSLFPTGPAPSDGNKVWIDQFDVTAYVTGFKVNPDGTGTWPDLEGKVRPVGEVTMWYGAKANIPAGWLPLDGTTFDPAQYPDLQAFLGTTTLPDFTDLFPIGAGVKAVGSSGGSATVQLTEANLPPHSHTIGKSSGTGSSLNRVAAGSATAADPQNTGAGPGTATPVDIMPPWRALWFIIRAA